MARYATEIASVPGSEVGMVALALLPVTKAAGHVMPVRAGYATRY